jgi:hypothetical protein
MADEKFHNDADKTVYKFHSPDNADHYEEPAEDAKRDEQTDKADQPEAKSSTTTKTSSTKTSTAPKEK